MAENQQAHRQALEVVAVNHDARRSMAGVVAGVVVALGVLVLAGVLAAFGQPVESVATIIADMAFLAGVFVYGTYMRRKERATRLEKTLNPTVDVSAAPDEESSGPQLPRE